MKLRALLQQSSLYTLGNVANRAAGMLMLPVYTSFLSDEDYGLLELIELFLAIAAISLGLRTVGDAMVRIFHEFEDEGDRARVVSSGFLLTAVLAAAVSLLGVALAGPLSAAAFDGQFTELVRVAFVALFFADLVELGLIHERLRERALSFVAFSLVQLVCLLALNIWFIAFLGMGVWGFVTAKLITSVLGCAWLSARLVREVGLAWDREAVRRMLRFGLPLVPAGIAFFVVHFSDRLFLNHYVGLGDVGLYALAYKFAFLITWLVGEPFGRAWNVSFYAHVNQPGWRERFARVARYLAFFLFLVGTGIVLFVDEAIRVLAHDNPVFWGAASLVPLLVLGYVLRELGDFHRELLYINKRAAFVSALTMACAVLNLALNFVLIGAFGLQGAVAATLLTWIAYLGATWGAAHAEHRVPFRLTPLVAIAALCWGLDRLGADLPAAGQWLLSALLLLLFLALVWLSGWFPPDERALIRGHARSALRRLRGASAT